MATPAAQPPKPAAGAAPEKKSTVPKEMRQALIRGQDLPKPAAAGDPPKPVEGTPAPKFDAAGKPIETTPPAAGAAPAGEPRRVKKAKVELPPIPSTAPPAGAAPPVTAAEIRQIVAEGKPAPTGAAAPEIKPDDRNDLDLAEFAARKHADRYGDLPGKLTKWFETRDQHLVAKAKELGGRDSAEFRDYLKSEDLGRFVRENAPSYQRGDAKKIYEEKLRDEGAETARAALKPELDALSLKQREQELRPIHLQQVANGVVVLLDNKSDQSPPDEAIAEFLKAPEAFVAENPIEGGLIVRESNFFRVCMEEALSITSGLKSPIKGNKTHEWLEDFVARKEARLADLNPNGLLMADDKILVTAEQMERLRVAKAPQIARYRLLTPTEIVGMIAVEGQDKIKKELKAERERLQKAGYVRAPKTEAIKKDEIPPIPPPKSPIAGSSPARGAGGGSPPAKKEHWSKRYTKG